MPEKPYLITPQDFGGEARLVPSPVTAPGPYVEMGHAVRLDATSSIASATLRLRVRLLTAEGEITDNTQDMVITGTGIQTAIDVRVGRGWIIGLSVRAIAGTIADGDIVASVHLVSGSGASSEYLTTLASGEVTRTRALGLNAYTIAIPSSSSEITPTIATATSSPGAGSSATWTVPAGELWELITAKVTFTTAVAVATRQVAIFISLSGVQIAQDISVTTQIASLAVGYSFHRNAGYATATAQNLKAVIMPAVYVPAAGVIAISAYALQGADQFSDCILQYRSYAV